MKEIFFLFLVILWVRGHPIDIAPTKLHPSNVAHRNLSPKDMGISTHEDHDQLWFVVDWSKVEDLDKSDPILGYKVKIWVVKKVKSIAYAYDADGNFAPTQVEALPKLDIHKDASDDVTEIDVPADKTEATYHGMKKGVTYEIGVFAYTGKQTGSSSNKMRIAVEADKTD